MQIIFLVVFFVCGLALARDQWSVAPALLLLCVAFALFTQRTRWWFAAIALAGLALGLYRGQIYDANTQITQSLIGQRIELTGRVRDDPVRSEKGHLRYTLGQIEANGQTLPGEIRVRSHYTWLKRGFLVKVNGKLEAYEFGPQLAEFGFASVQVLDNRQDWLQQQRERFFTGVYNSLPEPLASFGISLLTGARSGLPRELQDDLAAVGLAHIIAVSGYNLTIIVEALRRSLGRLSHFGATAGSLWLSATFTVLTGASASIVRAAVVSGLVILTSYYGYKMRPLALIALAVGITAWINPAQVFLDLGWQLSFLAFYGILVLAPLLQQRWRITSAAGGLISESLAAQLMTYPLVMWKFGQFSAIAPLANLLVLPLIPLVMLFSFAAGLAGMLLPTLAGWVGLPAQALLALITELTSRMVRWPLAHWQLTSGPTQALQAYLIILALSALLAVAVRRHQQRAAIMAALCPDIPNGQPSSIRKRLPMPGGGSHSPSSQT